MSQPISSMTLQRLGKHGMKGKEWRRKQEHDCEGLPAMIGLCCGQVSGDMILDVPTRGILD